MRVCADWSLSRLLSGSCTFKLPIHMVSIRSSEDLMRLDLIRLEGVIMKAAGFQKGWDSGSGSCAI